ncbi:histone-lysine N-methyltransferase SETMAR [Trichonephila clavipes]|nr:histone-lysine N-methyltransferase SETMAR [Trichonephila clavipes]
MLFEFQNRNNTTGAKRNLWDVFGEEVVTARTCQRWLVEFHSGDFSLKDEPRSRRSSDVSKEVLRKMISTNPTLTFTEVGFKLDILQTTALNYIKRLGFVSKLSVWVPYELTPKTQFWSLVVTGKWNAKRSSIPYQIVRCGRALIGVSILIGSSEVAGRRGYKNGFGGSQSWKKSSLRLGLVK